MADLGNHFYIVSLTEHSETASISKLVAWIRVPHLSFEFFTKSILAKIGNCFDRVLRIDETTLNRNRAQFARIGVEIDLGKPLQSEFVFRNQIRYIQYESLHEVCFGCGKYGHRMEACPKKVQPNVVNTEQPSHTHHLDLAAANKVENIFDPEKNFGA